MSEWQLFWNIKSASFLCSIYIISMHYLQYTFLIVYSTFTLLQKELHSYYCSNHNYYLQSITLEYHIGWIDVVWTRLQLFTSTSTALSLQVFTVHKTNVWKNLRFCLNIQWSKPKTLNGRCIKNGFIKTREWNHSNT